MEINKYINQIEDDKKGGFEKLRTLLKENLPVGFEEEMQYGMLTFVVPLKTYPKGYHCKANTALPFVSIAAQKKHLAVYHMGLYADPELYKWFETSYKENYTTKIDIGKSCIRFKKETEIPFDLLAELFQKITPNQWIAMYERVFRK